MVHLIMKVNGNLLTAIKCTPDNTDAPPDIKRRWPLPKYLPAGRERFKVARKSDIVKQTAFFAVKAVEVSKYL